MNEDYNIISTRARNMGLAGDHRGFVGRYRITPCGIEDLGADLWCEDTVYAICPFKTSQKEFFTRCMEILAAQAPADIFHAMSNIDRHSYYVPMVKAGNRLVCLHSQLPQLSYEFLSQGTCSVELATQLLGEPQPFNVESIDPRQTEFLSIWLSLADVSYVANVVGEQFNHNAAPQVVFIPVHYLAFDYDGQHYTIMSFGDKQFSQLTSRYLPADEVLTGQKLLYNRPWLSICLLLVLQLLVIIVVLAVCARIWISLDWFFLYRLIVFAIPIFIVYIIAWNVMRLVGLLLRYTMLSAERFCAKLWQRRAIKRNFKTKHQDLVQRMPDIDVVFPKVNSISIDTGIIRQRFDSMLNRLAMTRIIDKLDGI